MDRWFVESVFYRLFWLGIIYKSQSAIPNDKQVAVAFQAHCGENPLFGTFVSKQMFANS